MSLWGEDTIVSTAINLSVITFRVEEDTFKEFLTREKGNCTTIAIKVRLNSVVNYN